jgi:hypothetical protein
MRTSASEWKIAYILAAFLFPFQAQADALRDYTKFDHTVTMTSLRAGNHDPSGQNQYFFRLTQYALANTKDERLKPIEERKKSSAGSQDFGQIELAALSQWIPPEVTDDTNSALAFNSVRISGDSIRESTSNMMRAESISEAEVAHLVIIELFERDKKYFLMNEDKSIATTRYFPIPPSSFDGSERLNQTLQITDDKGTQVKLTVTYDSPIANPGISASEQNKAATK